MRGYVLRRVLVLLGCRGLAESPSVDPELIHFRLSQVPGGDETLVGLVTEAAGRKLVLPHGRLCHTLGPDSILHQVLDDAIEFNRQNASGMN